MSTDPAPSQITVTHKCHCVATYSSIEHVYQVTECPNCGRTHLCEGWPPNDLGVPSTRLDLVAARLAAQPCAVHLALMTAVSG